jgi:hypothetical protein
MTGKSRRRENKITLQGNPLFRRGKHTLQVMGIKIHRDAMCVIDNVRDQPI